jgi:hypothetical protein
MAQQARGRLAALLSPLGSGPPAAGDYAHCCSRSTGVFKAHVMDAVSVRDGQTWEHTTRCAIEREFTQRMKTRERRTARHGWNWL